MAQLTVIVLRFVVDESSNEFPVQSKCRSKTSLASAVYGEVGNDELKSQVNLATHFEIRNSSMKNLGHDVSAASFACQTLKTELSLYMFTQVKL